MKIRLIEFQLAHLDKNKSRASYDHAERLEPRAVMMQAWADLIDTALVSPRELRSISPSALARVAPKNPDRTGPPRRPLYGCTATEVPMEHTASKLSLAQTAERLYPRKWPAVRRMTGMLPA